MKHFVPVTLANFYLLLNSCTPRTDYKERNYKRFEVGKFTVQVPSTWQPVDVSRLSSLSGMQEAYSFQSATEGDISYGENVFLRFSSYGIGKSPSQLTDELIGALRHKYGQVTLVKMQDTVVNNIAMRIVDYTLPAQKPAMYSTAVFAKCDSITTQIEFSALDPSRQEYSQVRSVFGSIAMSLARK